MPYLLNLIYVGLLLLASPFMLYRAVRHGKYREGWGPKLLGRVGRREGSGPCVWFHAVSVGEINVLRTLVRQFQEAYPNVELVVSTTTQTGYEVANRIYSGLKVFYCPMDFTWSVRRAVAGIRPDLLVMAELEIWPNLIREMNRRGRSVAIVNGRLGEKSFRGYYQLRFFAKRVLKWMQTIAVQHDAYAQRFIRLGAAPTAVHVTGSMKFDGAETDRNNPRTRRLAKLTGWKAEQTVFLAGSTVEPEERIVLQAFDGLRKQYSQLRLILVPRHPERFDQVALMLDESNHRWQRRSELQDGALHPHTKVLLVDTVGELADWWGVADVGFVGGSLEGRRGGQSMIEPAAYGVAVCFGPYTHNFRGTVQLMRDQQAAVIVEEAQQLTRFVGQCLEDPQYAKELGRRAAQLVRQQLGATRRTLDLLIADLLRITDADPPAGRIDPAHVSQAAPRIKESKTESARKSRH